MNFRAVRNDLLKDYSRVKRRDWCFTIWDYTDDDIQRLLACECVYIIFGKEKGENNNPRLHLQGYIMFKNPVKMNFIKETLGRWDAHLEPRKGTLKAAIEYCKKEGDFLENGKKPLYPEEKGKKEQDRWEEYKTLALEGKFDDLPAKILILHGEKFKRLYYENREKELKTLENITCLWLWGKPRTGKTMWANKRYPDAYIKMDNPKWWDGYRFQKVVILDDVTPERWRNDADLMKKIADIYKIRVERKGGDFLIRPETIIVTSNYTIERIWEGKQEDIEALKDRFEEIEFKEQYKDKRVRHNKDIKEILESIKNRVENNIIELEKDEEELEKTQEVILDLEGEDLYDPLNDPDFWNKQRIDKYTELKRPEKKKKRKKIDKSKLNQKIDIFLKK